MVVIAEDDSSAEDYQRIATGLSAGGRPVSAGDDHGGSIASYPRPEMVERLETIWPRASSACSVRGHVGSLRRPANGWGGMSGAPDQALHIDVFTEDGHMLVVLAGELDLVSADSFARSIAELPSPSRVVVDLSGLTFVDSSGVNVLVQSVRAIEIRGGRAVLAAPSPFTRRVFEITRLTDIVTVADDRNGALNGFG
jgi:anti-sigma B factor antagonist